jgi:hypothetical protein
MTPEPPSAPAPATPGAPEARAPTKLAIRVAALVKDYAAPVAALGGLVGAIVYALMWVVLLSVYRPLGVTPSEVGLDYASVLVATAVVMIAATALAGVLEGLVYVSSRLKLPVRVGFAVVAAVALTALAAVAHALNAPAWIVVGLITVVLLVTGEWLSEITRDLGQRNAFAFALLFGGGLIIILLLFRAIEDTPKLKRGERPNRLYIAPVPWDARIAQITQASGAAADIAQDLPKGVLLLGAADGTTALYDSTANAPRAILVPSSDVTIEVRPQAENVSSC